MIGTEFLYGQGLGNQLFCYVSTRCIALDKQYEFGTIGQNYFGDKRFNQKGPYFLDIDLGKECSRNDFQNCYIERSTRFHQRTSEHDRTIGCDISSYDPDIINVRDGTLLSGIMQSERYFLHHKQKVKDWLTVKPIYDSYEFFHEDLCILNVRGGEYVGLKEVFLKRGYWLNAMKNMKKINPSMRFMIVTDDVKTSNSLLPDIEAFHFDLAKDYVTIKNAKYLILSNSSFAFFSAFTSDTLKYIIAPKYWARHNVSDGYWSTGQNIYSGWHYQDKGGHIYSCEECRGEFKAYSGKTSIYNTPSFPIEERIIRQLARSIKNKLRTWLRNLKVTYVSKARPHV